MRIDKYLKITRLVKRRSVGKELCDHGKVLVNDKSIKASYEVKIGDTIAIIYGRRKTVVTVTDIKKVVKKEDVGILYDLVSVEKMAKE